MSIKRPFWEKKIEEAWQERSIIWLMGVRRIGKTTLCLSIPNIVYYDCEKPRTRQLFADPEGFLDAHKNKVLALDEIHRLDNPSELLKIAADYYPDIKIIATGSSTLGASKKFKDTLTGRKREIWLTPLLLQEMAIFGNEDIRHRFLFGGFPGNFMSPALPEKNFQEWVDAYWTKDIEDIFNVGKKASFQKFAELLMAHSGGLFEATRYATACEVTRQTIMSYLDVLEETFVVHVVRPYATHKPTEIVSAPKIYGFDTGFVSYAKGWRELKQEDTGLMWEQCVLNELHGQLQTRTLHYWRSKRGHEIDFVIPDKGNNHITAIECKFIMTEQDFASSISKNFEQFRALYPNGKNYIVASNIDTSFTQRHAGLTFSCVSPQELINQLQ